MTQLPLEELKVSYYEYLEKVPAGLSVIHQLLEGGDYSSALQSLANLSEGIEALLLIETKFKQHGFTTNSRLNESIPIFEQMNLILENENYTQLAELTNVQLAPIFTSAIEWSFVEATK